MVCRHCGGDTVERVVTRTLPPCAGLLFELRSPVFVCDAHPGQGRVVHDEEWLEVRRQLLTTLAERPPSGMALAALFKRLGLSIDEGAEMFGVSREKVRAWVRGDEQIPITAWVEVVTRVLTLIAREDRPLKDVVFVRLIGPS